MFYQSTRGNIRGVRAAQAVAEGIAPDGGLYVPAEIPHFSPEELHHLLTLTHEQRAEILFSLFFDFPGGPEAARAYQNFSCRMAYAGNQPVLELFHGPTAAFKDMALQVLPRLLSSARQALDLQQRTLILTATSGDTGSAALAGFANVAGTAVLVFYPEGGVSPLQQLQMLQERGANVRAVAVRGNFDDAQTAVKNLFGDETLRAALGAENCILSSANSINWGRLAPQIAYYFTAYACLLADGRIREGDPLSFVVPTGNFGNILAGWYAGQMGLPVGKLLCASNRNNVLTDFFTTGTYDARREFYKTLSPSMDILVSSNLERLLYELSGRNGETVAQLMAQLRSEGKYTVDGGLFARLQESFAAGSADDEQTQKTIAACFESCGYLADPHTAVALHVARQQQSAPAVVLSTASPYKFPAAMLQALGQPENADASAACAALQAHTGVPLPAALAETLRSPAHAPQVIDIAEMAAFTLSFAREQQEQA